MTCTPLQGELKGLYRASYKEYASYGSSEKEALIDLKQMLKKRKVKYGF